jgi:hypothetical protein
MPKFADMFATVHGNRIVSHTSGTPPHELLPNQFSLTKEEFFLLNSVRAPDVDKLEYIEKLVIGLKEKVERVSGE